MLHVAYVWPVGTHTTCEIKSLKIFYAYTSITLLNVSKIFYLPIDCEGFMCLVGTWGSSLVEKVLTVKGILQLKLIHLNHTLTFKLMSSSLLSTLMLRKVDMSILMFTYIIQTGISWKQTLVLEGKVTGHLIYTVCSCLNPNIWLVGRWRLAVIDCVDSSNESYVMIGSN